MRGHIVGAFDGVAVKTVVLGAMRPKKSLRSFIDVGIGILLHGEGGRGVLDKKGQQPGLILHSSTQADAFRVNSYSPLPFVRISR